MTVMLHTPNLPAGAARSRSGFLVAVRTGTSHFALRSVLSLIGAASATLIAAQPAYANCVGTTAVVCDGATGPNTSGTISGATSVTFLNGETQAGTNGLVVSGSPNTPTVAIAIDRTSSITASTASPGNDGSALSINNNFGGILTTTPGFTGIGGNLTSSVGAGLAAVTNNTAGNIALVQNAGSVIAGGTSGISATVQGGGTIAVTTSGTVSSTAGSGIATTTGATGGATTVTANGNVAATAGTAVLVTTAVGAATVVQAAGSTITGSTDAIRVNNTTGGAIVVNALGTLVANNGTGAFVNTTAASADPISVTTNVVRSTGGAGTWASQVRASAGSGDITITSNGTQTSALAPGSMFGGILVLTNGTSNRNVTANVNADIGTPTDRSSAAQVLINGTSSSARTLAVNVANANIFGGPGAVAVTHSATSLGDIRVTGTGTGTMNANGATAVGINVRNLNAANAGNIVVDVTQSVSSTLQGINATTVGSGTVAVTARGNVTATNGTGILAASVGAVQVTIGAGTTTTGTQGVDLQGVSANALIVNGTLRNTGGTTPFTVRAGGPFTLTLGPVGSIVGPLAFTTGNDTFNSQGTFALPAALDFSGGTDVLNNTGTLTALNGASTITSLETLNNSGTIDLRNGAARDSVAVSGSYSGSGAAAVGVDIASGTATDRLVIGGAATGSTALLVSGLNGQFVNNAVVVDAGAGSSAGAFAVAARTVGLTQYSLAFAPATNDFVITGAPNASALAPLQLAGGAREVFYKTNDAIGSHLSEFGGWSAADDLSPGTTLWMTMQGSRRTVDRTYTATVFGAPYTYNLGTQQDFFGLQGGADFAVGSNAVVGLTAGVGTSDLRVPDGAGKFNYRSLNVGAYGRINTGVVFASALVRYERYNIRAESIAAGYNATSDGHAWGGRAELGAHFGSDKLFFEPVVSIDYARVRIDGYRALDTDFGFADRDGLRGKAGGRFGAVVSDGPSKITAYGRAMAVHEFKGEDSLTLVNNGSTLVFINPRQKTLGEAAVGVNISSPGGIRGFIEGTSEFAGRVSGFGGRAGLAIRF